MISPNIQNKLPGSALGYFLISRIISSLILIAIGIALTFMKTVPVNTAVNGVSTGQVALPTFVISIILFLIAIIIPFWTAIWYSTFSYVVGDQNITINSGVLFRQSKTIDFNKIQNVDDSRGPIQMMFGLTQINIWTASEDQIQVVHYGRGGSSTRVRPDGMLYLASADAQDLKNFVAAKGSVQTVQMASPNMQQPQL